MITLLRNAIVHTGLGGADVPTAVAVEDDRIVLVGDEDAATAYAAEHMSGHISGHTSATVVDCHGALLAPAFVDAHVHAVQTGFLSIGLDLGGVPSLQEMLEQVAEAARSAEDDEIIVGGGWDDSLWDERRAPTAEEIEQVAPGARVMMTRLDAHSAVLSPALMVEIDGLSEQLGYNSNGHMTLDAMAHAVTAMARLIGPTRRLEAARATMRLLAGEGVAAFHENAAPHIGPAYEVDLVRRAATETGLLPTFYWGEHLAVDLARQLGVVGLAGDLNADGSIGSHTAALHEPYEDRPGHSGHAYLSADEIAEHVVVCTREGLQGGFHCIGTSGLEAVTEGFRLAEKQLGREALRAARHRLEHVEMPSAETLEMMADLGVVASMQPLFDELWGGPDQMYAERLGGRWRGMNPIGDVDRAGIVVALGSDTPVTRPRPWEAIRAACRHHEESQRVDRETAFRMHTVGGWHAGLGAGGTLAVGEAAHLAVWETELDGTLPPLDADPVLRLLLVGGRTVFEKVDRP